MPQAKPDSRASASLLRPALAAAALALFGCLAGDRTAGTSTTVGNTVSGAAILSDGRPAARAQVSLRAGAIQVTRSRVPAARLIAFATADSVGVFSLPRPVDTVFHVEILQAAASPLVPRDSLQVMLLALPLGLPDSGGLGQVKLQPPGGLTGRLVTLGPPRDSTRWIGAQGTDNFVRVEADGSFRLGGLSPGRHTLLVVDIPDLSIAGTSSTVQVRQATPPAPDIQVTSGSVTDLGGMLYYDNVRP